VTNSGVSGGATVGTEKKCVLSVLVLFFSLFFSFFLHVLVVMIFFFVEEFRSPGLSDVLLLREHHFIPTQVFHLRTPLRGYRKNNSSLLIWRFVFLVVFRRLFLMILDIPHTRRPCNGQPIRDRRLQKIYFAGYPGQRKCEINFFSINFFQFFF
jgi:hypothetical protein